MRFCKNINKQTNKQKKKQLDFDKGSTNPHSAVRTPTTSAATQPLALRGRYGTRFERWWPHYYHLMVYVSEEAMFLSGVPSQQQKAVCCSYLARPAAGANLQCIKQATTADTCKQANTHKAMSCVCVCVCVCEREREGEWVEMNRIMREESETVKRRRGRVHQGSDWMVYCSVYLWIIYLKYYTQRKWWKCNVFLAWLCTRKWPGDEKLKKAALIPGEMVLIGYV